MPTLDEQLNQLMQVYGQSRPAGVGLPGLPPTLATLPHPDQPMLSQVFGGPGTDTPIEADLQRLGEAFANPTSPYDPRNLGRLARSYFTGEPLPLQKSGLPATSTNDVFHAPRRQQESGSLGFPGGIRTMPFGDAYPDIPTPQREMAPELDWTGVFDQFERSAPSGPSEVNPLGAILMGLGRLGDSRAGDWSSALADVGSAFALGTGTYLTQRDRAQADFDSAQREHAARRAELEMDRASASQEYAQSALDVDFQNRMAQRQDMLAKWEAEQPQILSSSGGVLVYTTTGPDGKRTLATDTTTLGQMYQARAAAAALGKGTVQDSGPDSDDPADWATYIASKYVTGGADGMLAAQLGLDWQDVVGELSANSELLAPGGGQFQNQKMQQMMIAKLAEGLMRNMPMLNQLVMQEQ